ncbi:MAG TPA: hypothetical protein VGU26_02600 [Gaiellaceae bacterium]|nr:hypothetical protein [Gaiellaceae bacterium]
MILWALCIALAAVGFGILLMTLVLLAWQMVEVGLLWVVLLIAGFFAVYAVVVLWDRYRKASRSDRAGEDTAAADLW